VVEGYVQAPATAARWGAAALRRLQTGVVTTYLSWVAGAAVLLGVVAVLAGGRW
jgi:NADH-quinone oxidoreductase subunit L